MNAVALSEIRSARMQIAANSNIDSELKAAIGSILKKHNIHVSEPVIQELMITTSAEFETAFGPGEPLPVGLQCK